MHYIHVKKSFEVRFGIGTVNGLAIGGTVGSVTIPVVTKTMNFCYFTTTIHFSLETKLYSHVGRRPNVSQYLEEN